MDDRLRLADNLNPPATEAVTQTFVVYGGKGTGKTNLGRVMAEEFSRTRQRFVAMDPLGVWWGLKHSADGKGPGIDVLLLGGRRGDIPIVPTAGAVVADLVVDSDVDVVVDFSRHPDGRLWSKGEKIRFATAFTQQFYQRQGERMRPTAILWDEVARFVPQTIPKGALAIAECMGAIEDVVEEGRNVAIGIGMITQRSARLNKSVSELAECMIAFRTVGPRSIDAILDWFGDNVPKERWNGLVDTIRHLKVGQALVVSPGWLNYEGVVNVRLAHTFDSSATPKAEGRGVPRKLERADLAMYERRMAATIEAAKEIDPKALRAEVARLKATNDTLARRADEAERREKARAGLSERPQAKVVPMPALTDAQVKRFETASRQVVTTMAALSASAERWAKQAADVEHAANLAFLDRAELLRAEARGDEANGTAAPITAAGEAGVPIRLVQPEPGDSQDGPSRILKALAQFEILGVRQVGRNHVAALARMSPTSSTTKGHLRWLREERLIEDAGGEVRLTDKGRHRAPAVDVVPSRGDMVGAWRSLLGEYERALLNVLEKTRKPVPRGWLAEQAGKSPTSSTFKNALRKMRDFGVVDVAGDDVGIADGMKVLEAAAR